MLKYARILIEMKMDGSFPEYIQFVNERGVVQRQRVTYEWQPIKCTHCHLFGHTAEVCRKKQGVRQVWREKIAPTVASAPSQHVAAATQQAGSDVQPQTPTAAGDFTPVSPRHQAKRFTPPSSSLPLPANPFEVISPRAASAQIDPAPRSHECPNELEC